MRNVMSKLWADDCGIVVQTELVFLVTILVLGTITAMVAVRQALISEYVELANAIMALNQSYSFSGQSNCESSTAGSQYTDVNGVINDFGVPAATPSSATQSPCD